MVGLLARIGTTTILRAMGVEDKYAKTCGRCVGWVMTIVTMDPFSATVDQVGLAADTTSMANDGISAISTIRSTGN